MLMALNRHKMFLLPEITWVSFPRRTPTSFYV